MNTTKMTLKEQVYETIDEYMHERMGHEIQDYDSLRYVGVDDIKVLDLMCHLEEQFNIEFEGDESEMWLYPIHVFRSVERLKNAER